MVVPVRASLLVLLFLAACGRTDLRGPPAPDASVVTPPPPPPPPPEVKDPLTVFEAGRCPSVSTRDALKPGVDERVFAVEFLAQEECSGAGGDWLIGRELDGTREVALGEHACWFLPDAYRGARQTRYGVVRVDLLPVTTQVPDGWCLETVSDGLSPKTDVNVLALGVYETEDDARLAARALE